MSSEKLHNTSITIKGKFEEIEAEDIEFQKYKDPLSRKPAKLGTL